MPKDEPSDQTIYEYRDLAEMAEQRSIAAGMHRSGGWYLIASLSTSKFMSFCCGSISMEMQPLQMRRRCQLD